MQVILPCLGVSIRRSRQVREDPQQVPSDRRGSPRVPVLRARQIVLTAAERRRLKQLSHSRTAPFQQVVRVRIVLDAALGYSNNTIARRQGVRVDTVRLWRGRYAEEGLAGLADRPRSGRPRTFTPVQIAEVKALACQLPAETGTALSRWSRSELAAEVTGRGIAETMSARRRVSVKRWRGRSGARGRCSTTGCA
ncbi:MULTISPECIES: helix-turn-helix domain-containing protein [unclassified Streptosporangium]|uniref:helix-turn-helix domain-containing protein n=1 Tax=unclassified Streptosporangium TaxID=2632669 RepID=UPI002E2E1CC0|nr:MULTISPECIES: helix-turn-helix domain-containing protein [unclassified Streptosporangium]